MENLAESDSTVIVCVFLTTVGSAQISKWVFSGPTPANASATTTFRFAGKPLAASLALPENTFSGSVKPSTEILFSIKCGAPFNPNGGLLVTILTENISPSAAATIASRPINAPVGTMMVPPVVLASSINSGLNKIAPTDKTIAFFLARKNGAMMSPNNSAGAHSTTTSASGSNSVIGRSFTGYAKVFTKSVAFSWFLAETAVNTTPGISPLVKRVAKDLPIAPKPAMATRRGLVVVCIGV